MTVRLLSRFIHVLLMITLLTMSVLPSVSQAQTFEAAVAVPEITTSVQAPMNLTINTYTGSAAYIRKDLLIPSETLPIEFTMHYASVLAGVDLGYGKGWQFSYNLFYQVDAVGVVVFLGDGTAMRFNQQGDQWVSTPATPVKLQSVEGGYVLVYPDGLQYFFENSQHGQITRMVDRNGNQLTFTYTRNQLTAIADSRGRSFTLGYSGDHLTSINLDGTSFGVQYQYDEVGHQTAVTDQAALVTQYSYQDGLLTTVTDPDSNMINLTYDAGRVTAVNSALSAQALAYDLANSVTTATLMVNGVPATTTYHYNPDGQIQSITDALGNSEAFSWDAAGQMVEHTDPNGGTTRYSYDAAGNLVQITDALGNTTRYTYDAQNRLIQVQESAQNVTRYTYDERGNLISSIDALGNQTAMVYDEGGNLVSITDPAGNQATLSVDGFGYPSQRTDATGYSVNFSYDSRGQLLNSVDSTGSRASYTYDVYGRMIAVISDQQHYEISYDSRDNVTRLHDTNGTTFLYTYDALDRLVGVVDSLSNQTGYRYDEAGNLTGMTDANGHTTTHTYDGAGNLIGKTDPTGQTTTLAYDRAGNLISQTDPAGALTTFTYDPAHRLTGIAYPDGQTVSYRYDALGQRTSMIDSTGTTTYTYDAAGNLTSTTDPNGTAVSYEYNHLGQVSAIIYPDQTRVQYSYDTNGNLVQVEMVGGAVTYGYDPAGNLIERRLPNGIHTTYRYDEAEHLTGITHADSSDQAMLQWEFILNPVGFVTQSQQSTGAIQYEYDLTGQVTAALYPDGSFERFAYDAVGNRLTKTAPEGTTSYTYNAADQLELMAAPDGTLTTFAYDVRGNLISETSPTSTTAYTYDAADHLIRVEDGTTVSEFRYNGDGDRVAKLVNGQQTDYALDTSGALAKVIGVYPQGEAPAHIVYGGDVPLGQIVEETPQFFLEDELGSVIALVAPDGIVSQSTSYSSYGTPNTTISDFGFTGNLYDAETGLLYLRARYYDPDLGRFLTRDSFPGVLTLPPTLQDYVYVTNNPINFTDPSGHLGGLCEWVVQVVVTIVVETIVGGIEAAIEGRDFFEGMKEGFMGAVTDPTTYIPGSGIFKGASKVAKFVRKGLEVYERVTDIQGKIERAQSAYSWASNQFNRFSRNPDGTTTAYGSASSPFYGAAGDPNDPNNPNAGSIGWGASGGMGLSGLGTSPDVGYGCLAAAPSRTFLGDRVFVEETSQGALSMRQEPSTTAERLAFLDAGTAADVLDGPVCGVQNGLYVWWEIQTADGQRGWVAEADGYFAPPLYFITPAIFLTTEPAQALNCPSAPPSLVGIGDIVVVNAANNAPLRLRSIPSGDVIDELDADVLMTIFAGPECGLNGGFGKWWRVELEDGRTGWVAEGDASQTKPLYYILPEALRGMETGRLPIDLGCGKSPLTILKLGDVVEVDDNFGSELNLRNNPQGDVLRLMNQGEKLVIVGGPQCEGELSWWQVITSNEGEVGWISEGDASQRPVRYFINLVPEPTEEERLGFTVSTAACGGTPLPRLEANTAGLVNSSVPGTLPLLTSPFEYGTTVKELEPNDLVIVADGFVCGQDNQGLYWLVRTSDGDFGWVREGAEVYYIDVYQLPE